MYIDIESKGSAKCEKKNFSLTNIVRNANIVPAQGAKSTCKVCRYWKGMVINMIEFRNVSKIFKIKEKEVHALKDVNLKIEKGDIYGIIGFSGAGKSTLLRTINALEKPTEGKVFIEGEDINQLSSSKLRKKRKNIGMIFQQFNLLETKTVFENVALPLKLNKVPKEQIKKKVDEILEFVELSDKRDAYPTKLSGGQKQRVGIARALATEPSILLSDEATSALDPKTTTAILKLLKKINQELHITIVLITHEMNVIQSICNHVAVMENGEVVESGDVIDVFGLPKKNITKNFVKTVINDSVPEKLISGILAEKRNYKILRLKFLSTNTTEPVLAKINKMFDVETNILFANISEIQERILGIHIIQIIGTPEEIKRAETYFDEQQVEHLEVSLEEGE